MAKVYAYQNNLASRINSASGGAFSALVNSWIAYNNKVGIEDSRLAIYGAAYDDNFQVHHMRCDTTNWDSLKGSKYTVSNFAGVFELIDKDVHEGHNILFSGTPCQVASLKKYIERKNWNRDSFFLVDIVCHGTPEGKIWIDYKKYIERIYGGSLIKYNFRYKNTHSIEPIVYAEFSNGKIVKDTKELRSYLDLYFTYLPLRNCCYNCQFSNMNRVSDITIGDFWGADIIFKKINTYKGISQIIVNTDYGNEVFIGLSSYEKETLMECNSNEFLKYQHNLVSPTPMPLNVEEFRKYYDENGYEVCIHKYVGEGKKYAITFALKRFVSYLGIKQYIKRIIRS